MKKKLKLDKKTVAQLSLKEQSNIIGGVATTSFGSCTGWLCCTPPILLTEPYTACLSDSPGQPNCGVEPVD